MHSHDMTELERVHYNIICVTYIFWLWIHFIGTKVVTELELVHCVTYTNLAVDSSQWGNFHLHGGVLSFRHMLLM